MIPAQNAMPIQPFFARVASRPAKCQTVSTFIATARLGEMFEVTTSGRPGIYGKAIRREFLDEWDAARFVDLLAAEPFHWSPILRDCPLSATGTDDFRLALSKLIL